VTVAVVLLPPVTLDGLKLIDLTATPGVWVREPCTVLLPRLAVIVTVALLFVKSWAVAVNVALVLPAGTVTVAGISMYG
jgi:hypothetical protein